MASAPPPDHEIFIHYHVFCRTHCHCVPESEDYSSDPENSHGSESGSEGEGPLENGVTEGEISEASTGVEENTSANHQTASGDVHNVQHTCSGTCTQVARSCSWAYTGECMCTAASTPDPWGLFVPHGCMTVVKSKLGGRGLPGNYSSWGTESANSSAVTDVNSIVKGSNGYYNVSTGLQVACPCNTTCVSYGCCGSNGTTFAPQDKCLGSLDIASA